MPELWKAAVNTKMSWIDMKPDIVFSTDFMNVFDFINCEGRCCSNSANKNCWNQPFGDIRLDEFLDPFNTHWILITTIRDWFLRDFSCFQIWKLYCSFHCNITLSSAVSNISVLSTKCLFSQLCLDTTVHKPFTCSWEHDSITMVLFWNVKEIF